MLTSISTHLESVFGSKGNPDSDKRRQTLASATFYVQPASAHMDCHAMYSETKAKIGSSHLTLDHREAALRMAQHAYDMCTIADEEGAARLFQKINEATEN